MNSGEYKSVVGIDSVYIAEMTADSAAAYTTGTPEILAPVAKISMKPKTSQETQYADNLPYDVANAEAETEGEIELTNLPLEMQAKLLGSVFDSTTGRLHDRAGSPPYYALGFRALKSNGSYRYFWFYKVQFSAPEEEAETKTEKATPKVLKLAYKALKTVYQWTVGSVTDGFKRTVGDGDTTNFSATDWFTQVQTPGATSPDALALSSSSPVDDAVGSSKTAAITLTFNNALKADAIYNVALIDAAGANVALTGSLDATKKILTLTHAALTGNTAHTLAYAVVDIYNQHLAGAVTFTTAA